LISAKYLQSEYILYIHSTRGHYVDPMPFDEAASVAYGVLRAAVRDRRRDAFDRLIAAHALSVSATLVTNNEADFKDYPGLVVENWA